MCHEEVAPSRPGLGARRSAASKLSCQIGFITETPNDDDFFVCLASTTCLYLSRHLQVAVVPYRSVLVGLETKSTWKGPTAIVIWYV